MSAPILFRLLRQEQTEDILNILREHPELVNSVNRDGFSLLMKSIQYTNLDVVYFLLEEFSDIPGIHKLDVNIRSTDGSTALTLALDYRTFEFAEDNRIEVVEMLLSLGAQVNIRFYNALPIEIAARDLRDIDIVRLLVEYGATVDPTVLRHVREEIERDQIRVYVSEERRNNIINIYEFLNDVYDRKQQYIRAADLSNIRLLTRSDNFREKLPFSYFEKY